MHRAPAGEYRKELEHPCLVPTPRDRPCRDRDVLADTQVTEDAAALRHERDTRASDLVRRRPGEVGPADGDAPASWPHEARDGGDRRRLPRAVPADERNGFARGNLEIDALQDVALAVVGMEPVERDRELELTALTVRKVARGSALTTGETDACEHRLALGIFSARNRTKYAIRSAARGDREANVVASGERCEELRPLIHVRQPEPRPLPCAHS